jgi:branched-chain amino acid transport system substrate-binding protein
MPKRSILLTVLLTPSLLLASCGLLPYRCIDPLGCLEIPPGSPVVLGVLLASNGEPGPVGIACLESIEKVIAGQETILGHPILLERYATDGTPESARTEATDMATDPALLAVVGPSLRGEGVEATPILSGAGIVSLSPVPDPTAAKRMAKQVIAAIVQVAIQKADKTLIIPRLALREALNPSP